MDPIEAGALPCPKRPLCCSYTTEVSTMPTPDSDVMSEADPVPGEPLSDEVDTLGEAEEDLSLSAEDAYSATVSASDWTAETLLRQIERGNIDLDPAFQRREAWTTTKQSRFIESLIVGLPIPQIVLAERRGMKGRFLVLDGKQRLISMKKFMDGKLRLYGLDLRPELNGKRIEKLDDDDRTAFENQTLRTVTVRNWQTEDFLYLVFLRLNTASVPLSPQELRTALHPGPFVSFTNDYTAEHPEFARLFRKNATVDFRMRDIELLIRHFAFARFLHTYDGSLKNLLDSTCMALNTSPDLGDTGFTPAADECLAAIQAVNTIFGPNAFRLWREQDQTYENRFNRAIFDALVFFASRRPTRNLMLDNALKVELAFQSACEDPRFVTAVTATTKSKEAVLSRISIWGEHLSEALGSVQPSLKLKAGQLAYDTV